MKRPLFVFTVVVGTICLVLLHDERGGAQGGDGQRYAVTVTNLTRAQSFTPILVVTHSAAVRIFAAGTRATPELATLAEEGATAPLATALRGMPGDVGEIATSSGLLTPGVTVALEVGGGNRFRRFSMAAMLIPTNDGFFAIDSPLPDGSQVLAIDAPAYDAGSERNDELCASIPGPFFAECRGPGGGGRAGGGEGAVTIHNGMHGIGDFRASDRDWRNPVARITIRRAP